jgi:hypothetical protein
MSPHYAFLLKAGTGEQAYVSGRAGNQGELRVDAMQWQRPEEMADVDREGLHSTRRLHEEAHQLEIKAPLVTHGRRGGANWLAAALAHHRPAKPRPAYPGYKLVLRARQIKQQSVPISGRECLEGGGVGKICLPPSETIELEDAGAWVDRFGHC